MVSEFLNKCSPVQAEVVLRSGNHLLREVEHELALRAMVDSPQVAKYPSDRLLANDFRPTTQCDKFVESDPFIEVGGMRFIFASLNLALESQPLQARRPSAAGNLESLQDSRWELLVNLSERSEQRFTYRRFNKSAAKSGNIFEGSITLQPRNRKLAQAVIFCTAQPHAEQDMDGKGRFIARYHSVASAYTPEFRTAS